MKVNASSLKWTYCPRAYHLRVNEGWTKDEEAEALHVGTAVHEFVDKCYKTNIQDTGQAIQRFLPSYQGPAPGDVLSLCAAYPIRTPVNHSELKFEVQVGTDLYLYGTIDQVFMLSNGTLLIRDLKTTKHWKISEVMSWYKWSVQMAFYTYVASAYARDIFDNPLMSQHADNGVSMQVMVGQRPGGKSRPFAKWYDSPIYQYDTDHFSDMLELQLKDMLTWEAREYPQLGWANDKCGRCDMQKICHENDYTGMKQEPWKTHNT